LLAKLSLQNKNMKTLIITVGTRQVGWRCTDGIVRSLGADGGAYPPHVDELYTLELEQERERYFDQQSLGVRHLGEQLYLLCNLAQDFSPVELLLDGDLIVKEVDLGLTQVILWGTDQPEDISWKYRRSDTLWLAKLMGGKLRQLYPELQVDVWCPVLAANDSIFLCQSIEEYILNSVLKTIPDREQDGFTLLIENKGSVPLIANALEMCAVALSRQCQVKLIVPVEPDPLFISAEKGFYRVQCSNYCSYIPIGKYFWPLEKPKIISAWRRGDFGEAKLWLSAHQDRYKVIHKLAEYLQLACNWEVEKAIAQVQNQWIPSRDVKKKATAEQIELWKALAEPLRDKYKTTAIRYSWTWERMFLYEIAIEQQRYSEAFLRFALVLETIFSLQYETEKWLDKGYLSPPDGKNLKEYKPTLGGFVFGWCNKHQLAENDPWKEVLDTVCKIRNQIVHNGLPITSDKIFSILSPRKSSLDFESVSESEVICLLMQQVLKKVAHPFAKPPQYILLRSLYKWGLDCLEAER
jgi:hypothetical protein